MQQDTARGKMSYLGGMAAEDAVAAAYESRGHVLAAKRWRGSRGELDLVLRDGDGLIVVEVKQARDFARALSHLTQAQLARIYGTAAEFAAGEPGGQLTDLRLDVALVDWLDVKFVGRTTPRGSTVAVFDTQHGVGREFFAWEAAQPGRSSHRYPSTVASWAHYPYSMISGTLNNLSCVTAWDTFGEDIDEFDRT